MRVVCIDGEPQYWPLVERDVIPLLEGSGITLDWIEGRFDQPEEAIARAAGYDALYVVGDQGPIPDGMLRANRQLKLVSFVGTGARRFVPMAEAKEYGVTVTNVPDFASQSVAELAVALMFATARRVVGSDREVRAGEWIKRAGLKLAASRLGVIGAGAIGRRVIALGRGLGMDVVYWSRSGPRDVDAQFVELDEIFMTSRVVSVHLAQTPDTERLISRRLLELMPPDSILVNTARAEVVDYDALFELLQAGRIFGAGLDVFVREPPHPDDLPITGLNVVLTPHVGFHTDEADEVFRHAAANIVAFAAGSPTNVVENQP